MKKIGTVLIVVCCILYACKKGSESFFSTTTMLNAGIGMPPISLNVNGAALIANLPFDSIRYNIRNSSGTFPIHFSANGMYGLPDSGVNTGFSSGSSYTVIIYDSAKPVLIADTTKIYFQQDMIPGSVTDAKSSIRFFNLIPNSSSIYLASDTGTVTAGKVFLSARTFGDFGESNAFTEVDTTTNTNIRILNDTATVSTARFDSVSVQLDTYKAGLKNGKIYTFYLIGVIGGTGSQKPHLVVQQHN